MATIAKQRIATAHRQTGVPPALRRSVLARDQHRCRVPGCTHATFVDVHHIQPRSEGGRLREPTPEHLLRETLRRIRSCR